MYGESLLTLEDISPEALDDMTKERKSLHDVTRKIITCDPQNGKS